MTETMKGLTIPSERSQATSRLELARSFGVAPSPSVNGRCGIRLAPGDRRACRRRGRPLWSSLGPWPSIDGRRRCEKSRVGDR